MEKYLSCVQCCLVILFGFWVKKCQVFWETVPARVYELPSTSTKERRFCPFWWENFVFQSVCIFSKLVGFEATYFQFLVHWIFWQGCQSCIQVYSGPFHGENQSETTFFSKTFFFGFWTKVLGLFTKSFWQISEKPFYVSRGTVYEKVWDKKELINKTMSRNLFWQISDFWWNFCGRFVKTVFYLRVTFWWKAAFASETLIINFVWNLAQTLKVLSKLLPAQLYNLLSTCLKGKKLWVQIFEQNLWFWKFL